MTRSIDEVLSLARNTAEKLVREARDADPHPDRHARPAVRPAR